MAVIDPTSLQNNRTVEVYPKYESRIVLPDASILIVGVNPNQGGGSPPPTTGVVYPR